MKIKNMLSGFAVFTISALIWSGSVLAQDEEEGEQTIFLVSTFYVEIPDGGSMDELLEMLAEQDEATKENPNVLSQITLRHFFTADSREFLTITEYASLASMDEAFEISQQLIEEHWPDEEERDAWQDELGSYISHHSDAIYNSLPGLRQ